MDRQKLEFYKNLLLKEREDVLDTMNRMDDNEPNESMRDYFDELSTYDNHPADLGTETFMVDQTRNLKNVVNLRLKEIDESLGKIEDGTYGLCDICGKKIKEERLELIPEAKICLECANSKIPIDKMMDYRPKEEENLSFPFGRTFNDISIEDKVGVDGEDIYQSVERFNDIPNDPSHNTGDKQGVFDEREPGIVEDVEQISNEYYKGQLEGKNRGDIPDEQRKNK